MICCSFAGMIQKFFNGQLRRKADKTRENDAI